MGCSDFWKLDKIDKIGIALIFIIVSMFSIFDCFCYASTNVPFILLPDLVVGDDDIIYQTSGGGRILYANLEKNSKYTFSYDTFMPDKTPDVKTIVKVCKSLDLKVGSKVETLEKYIILEGENNNSFSFNTYNDDNLFLVVSLSGNWNTAIPNSSFVLTNDNDVFNLVIDKMTDFVGLSQLWSVFENLNPLVIIFVLFAFGYFTMLCFTSNLAIGKGKL